MVALMVALMVVVNVMLDMFKIALMLISVQSPGLVMVLLTVKMRPMAVILLAMIMMAETVQVVELLVVVVKTVMTVSMPLQCMVQSAVILHGMSMELIVLRLKVFIIGTAVDVSVLVTMVQQVVEQMVAEEVDHV